MPPMNAELRRRRIRNSPTDLRRSADLHDPRISTELSVTIRGSTGNSPSRSADLHRSLQHDPRIQTDRTRAADLQGTLRHDPRIYTDHFSTIRGFRPIAHEPRIYTDRFLTIRGWASGSGTANRKPQTANRKPRRSRQPSESAIKRTARSGSDRTATLGCRLNLRGPAAPGLMTSVPPTSFSNGRWV
jgi:hypothetical protein